MKYHAQLPRLVYSLLIAIVLSSQVSGQEPAGLAAPSEDAQEAADSEDVIQEPEQDGVWMEQRDRHGSITRTMRLTLYPRAEPSPALKYRLLPSEADMLDGNAVVHYLKAMGFLEQQPAHARLREIYSEASERARREGKEHDEVPPYVWQSMRPEELPLAEVQEFLNLTRFQRWPLQEARQRRRADFDRNLPGVDDVWGYLLPEIQAMRELARLQRLRCRVAIAEGDRDEAVAILGQQYAMARHLGQDDFIIPALVGIAVEGVAWEDALHFVRQPDAPNLYWAFASLPRPLIDIRHALDNETLWLETSVKVLAEVDETPRPAGYWQAFIDRLIPQLGSLEAELSEQLGVQLPDDPVAARAVFAGMIAAAYPGAKQYLIESGELDERLEAYPTAQVVFLAMLRYHDEHQQQAHKWTHLPYWQAKEELRAVGNEGREQAERVGWAALPTQWIGYAGSVHAMGAVARMEQQIALIQTIEAIRMAGAASGGKLPESLTDLPVPSPVDPSTGEPFDYRNRGSDAVLRGDATPHLRYRFVIRFSDEK